MYLVGLTVQAAVLGAVVVTGVVFEEPIRNALGLAPPPADAAAQPIADEIAALREDVVALDQRIAALGESLDATGAEGGAIAADLAALRLSLDGLASMAAPSTERSEIARRLRLVARVEEKVDDVRAAQRTGPSWTGTLER